ncbi:hypothetical protein Peur_028707 [Populus x canadensis]
MSFEHSESETRVPRSRINLQDRCSSSIMDVRARKITTNNPLAPPPNTRVEKRKMEYNRSLSQGSSRRLLTASHFSLVSLLLLVCLTASLLILPLVLPPLPPPPFMLLLLPIGILVLLMFLAFMPSNARDITYTWGCCYCCNKSTSVRDSSSSGFPPVVYTSSSAMLVMEYRPQVVALIVYLECLESTMQGIPVWPNLKILPFFLQIKAALLMFTYVKNANVPTKMVM